MSLVSCGELNHRIELQRAVISQDGLGAPQRSWVSVGTVWAHIEPLSGRDQVIAQRISNQISHQIILRYQSQLSNPKTISQYRVVYGSRIFQVYAALNEGEQNVVMTLYASEGVSDAA